MTSDSQEKSVPQPLEGDQKALPAAAKIDKKPETPRPSFGTVMAALLLMLLEILLPVIISAGIIWFLFANFNLWQAMDRTVGLILFGVAVVVIALLLAGVVDSLAAPFRKMVRVRGVRFTSNAQARLVKLALGGLIVPLVVVGVANFVPVVFGGVPRGTVMQMMLSAAVQPVKLAPPEEVGAIALSAENPSTKILSIQVLQGFQSPEALAQLVKLVNQDGASLSDPSVAGALSKAIAAYGTGAKLPLFNAFRAIDPAASAGAAQSSDLYTRYFAPSFNSLKAEINASALDSAAKDARLAQLQAAQAQLKDSLTKVQAPSATATGAASDPRLDFILQTFLAMDIKQDADLLAFARTTAMDTRYSSVVRGDALLLMGKLGGKDDLDALYPYLKTGDDLLQARALQAIAALQAKVGTTK